MTWPSFFPASINAGVTGSGGGASAKTRVENAAPASSAPVPLSMLRRDNVRCFIGPFHSQVLARSGTPDISAYSCGGPLVYGREFVALRADYLAGQAAPVFTQASTSAPASFCVPGAGLRSRPGAQAQPTSVSSPM